MSHTYHRLKSGTKNKTQCGLWLGKLPLGEYVAANPSRVNCPGCM